MYDIQLNERNIELIIQTPRPNRSLYNKITVRQMHRAGFRGGGVQGAQGPRPPTKRGPPTKPFNFYFALTIG